jgi:hypothetical protein
MTDCYGNLTKNTMTPVCVERCHHACE